MGPISQNIFPILGCHTRSFWCGNVRLCNPSSIPTYQQEHTYVEQDRAKWQADVIMKYQIFDVATYI